MATDISMCSNALLLLGEGTISSFTEPGSGALAASNLYESTYEAVLSEHRWRFASAKRSLARLVSSPLNEWTYAFKLPSDYLVAQKVYPSANYEIFENNLYADVTEISLDYNLKPDESRLPPYFVKAMEFFLAFQFAIPVTSNENLAKIYFDAYTQWIKKAKFLDSQARPADTAQHNPFVDVRA